MAKTAFAVATHPDDIEFMMAGTLILLKKAGYDIHYMNVANGSCGSAILSRAEAIRVRAAEARAAADSINARFHASLVPDINVLYEKSTLAKLAAVMRKVNPQILLVPSPNDYMEDHMNTCRLAVTAAFCMDMQNFPTQPPTKAVRPDCTIYHALPYGLHDGLRRRVWAGQYVDIGTVQKQKQDMLSHHKSQKEWLDHSQGLNSYLVTMNKMDRVVGRMSKRFRYAEGWRRHSHLGFSSIEHDPVAEALKRKHVIDQEYESGLLANSQGASGEQ